MPSKAKNNSSKNSTHGISPQAALVLDYLTSGRKLTPLVAHLTLGVASVTARVAELRKRGYDIKDAWEADHFNRRYKAYWMSKADGVESKADAPAK